MRESTKQRKRAIRYGMAVLLGWRFWRDVTGYDHGEWFATNDTFPCGLNTVGPCQARWMVVNVALQQMGVKG